MINSSIIAHTGVIVGLIYEKDQWHEWAFEQSKHIAPVLFTCETVITGAWFLLQNIKEGEQNILGMLTDGFLQVDFRLSDETVSVKLLMKKYKNVPMSLADACLVRMSELIDNSVIFTADSNFQIYRKNGRQKIALIIPNET